MQNKPPKKIADIQNIHNIAQGLYTLNISPPAGILDYD
jgi:hypothetical protein